MCVCVCVCVCVLVYLVAHYYWFTHINKRQGGVLLHLFSSRMVPSLLIASLLIFSKLSSSHLFSSRRASLLSLLGA